MDIDTVVQEKIDNDADFQATLTDLSDEDKEVAVKGKRAEIIKTEFETLKKQAEENEQKFKDQQVRAKKAEEEAKKAKTNVPKEDKEGLSQNDLIYVAKADIHEEDISDVVEYAKLKGISVKDSHSFMRPILEQRMAERKTANATQTKSAPGVSKRSPEAIIQLAREGKLPEEDIDKLAEAQMAIKLAKVQR